MDNNGVNCLPSVPPPSVPDAAVPPRSARSGISARARSELLAGITVFRLLCFQTGHRMRIVEHPESHIVKLDDGSMWQIFPGDIDRTLAWLPTTELRLFEINDEVASHALINSDDGTRVRVRPQGEQWPIGKLKDLMKQR